ncbi:MAG: ribonuclease J [Desulfonauticus sp.]|nr:ribonuclease J [Desulfonauticus sp.]
MSTALKLIPLGGFGEIGLNCLLLETKNSLLMIDCGLMFPDDYLFGIDVVIPSFNYVLDKKDKLQAIVITHGHEDHLGALPWLLPYVDVPIYSSAFSLKILENKLSEFNLLDKAYLRPVKKYDCLKLKDFSVTFFPVCHSIIEGFALGIETPIGKIVHTGDFKIDLNPINNQFTDLEAIKHFSSSGVKLLLSDSTNVEREGRALSEKEILENLQDIFSQAKGRILVTLFSSHIQRIQEIFDLAEQFGRKVVVSGKSLFVNIELAKELGFLKFKPDTYLSIEEAEGLSNKEMVLLLTGSQGEPLSALARLARQEHRQLSIVPGDLVIMSSRFIPGNTKAITRVINDLYKLGAEVIYEKVGAIHASGHAHKKELEEMINAVRPEYFIPIHGEYRHLVKHAQLAIKCGLPEDNVLIVEDGQCVVLSETGLKKAENLNLERVYVDGKGVGDVGNSILKERQILAGEGLVICVLVVERASGKLLYGPEIISKGFVFEQHFNHILEDAKDIVLDIYENNAHPVPQKLEDKIRSRLKRFFRKILDRDPVTFPIVLYL